MNLENKFLENEIFEGRIDIAAFILDSKCFFVFDDKENFTIDIRPFYDKYLEKGIITKEQHEYAIKHYRGGAFELNKKSIKNYFSSIRIDPKNVFEMKDFFLSGIKFSVLMEMDKNTNKFKMEINRLKMKMPRFYIDFDKNDFFHNYYDRSFEDELPLNWKGGYVEDLSSLFPLNFRYWIIKGFDFSKA